MAEPLADQIVRKIKQANELYHRLMLVVAPAGAGKTTALQDVQGHVGAPRINVNLDLSRWLQKNLARARLHYNYCRSPQDSGECPPGGTQTPQAVRPSGD